MVDISIKSKRSKLILGCLICAVAVVSMLSIIKKNIATVTTLKEEIIKSENNLVVLDKIYTDSNQKKSEVDKVLATIPTTYEEVSNYAKVIESTAAATGVTAESKFADAENKETSGVKSIGVSVRATGSYENLVRFVDGISNLPYHIEIDSIAVDNTLGAVNLTLAYRIFTAIN